MELYDSVPKLIEATFRAKGGLTKMLTRAVRTVKLNKQHNPNKHIGCKKFNVLYFSMPVGSTLLFIFKSIRQCVYLILFLYLRSFAD